MRVSPGVRVILDKCARVVRERYGGTLADARGTILAIEAVKSLEAVRRLAALEKRRPGKGGRT